MPKLDEDAETRLTVAALAAVIVRGAESKLPGLTDSVIAELDALQDEMRYWEGDPKGTIETLRWFRELLAKTFIIP